MTDNNTASSTVTGEARSNQTIQFVPIAVSETQPTNEKGRTICKVIGCSKLDFSYTNGFCKQHHALFYPGQIGNRRTSRKKTDTESWTCDCGQIISLEKKRCRSCSKWRASVASKPKKKRLSSESLDAASMPMPELPDSWTCVCGEIILSAKKRCWSCFKWRGGMKNTNVSMGNTADRNAKKQRVSEGSSDAAPVAMPKLPEIPDDPWTCVCGKINASKKKRCGGCLKWKGGSKSVSASMGESSVSDSKTRRSTRGLSGTVSKSMPKLSELPKPTCTDARSSRSKHINATTLNASTKIDADITKTRTSKDCAQRWTDLLHVRNQRKALGFMQNNYEDTAADPFDCSDLVVPSTAEIIEQEASKAIQRWNDLDSRIVLEEDGGAGFFDEASASDDNQLIEDDVMIEDVRPKLLPPNFDYKCASLPRDDMEVHEDVELPGEESSKHHVGRPKVISLLDPTQTLDYETELWHVFKSMPTTGDIEQKHGLLENNVNNGPSHALQHILEMKRDVKALLHKHTRMDAHSLGRLRIRDGHSTPQTLTSQPTHNNDRHNSANASCLDTSIRFEVFRSSVNLKRGSSRESNRLEVELSGSHHTLLDLHRIIVESAHAAEGQSDDSCIRSSAAGVFFIENTFYTHGDLGEDVLRGILQWLDGQQSNEAVDEAGIDMRNGDLTSRRKHLCISSITSSEPMSDMHLENLSLRLGTRYVHIFIDQSSGQPNKISLRNESALFVTDIQTFTSKVNSPPPIIHDRWAPFKPPPCMACNLTVASVVTMNDELTSTSSGGTPLCAVCYRYLHYQATGNDEYELRSESSHGSFKVLPIRTFNKLSFKEDMEKISDGALF